MKTPFDIIRALVSAMVAVLNSDSKEAMAKAQVEIDDLKSQLAASQKQLATDEAAIAASGLPLTADEQQHVLDVLAQANAAPAIAEPVPAQPVAPNAPEPVSAPVAPVDQPFIPTTVPTFNAGDKVKVIKDFFGAAKVGDEGTVLDQIAFSDNFEVKIGDSTAVLPPDALEMVK